MNQPKKRIKLKIEPAVKKTAEYLHNEKSNQTNKNDFFFLFLCW